MTEEDNTDFNSPRVQDNIIPVAASVQSKQDKTKKAKVQGSLNSRSNKYKKVEERSDLKSGVEDDYSYRMDGNELTKNGSIKSKGPYMD